MTDDEQRAIEGRLRQASPGPWTLGYDKSLRAAWAIQVGGSTKVIVNLDPQKNISLDEATHQVENDLDFLQNVRTDLESLLVWAGELREKASDSQAGQEDMQELQAQFMSLAQRYEQLHLTLQFYAHPQRHDPPAEPDTSWVGNDRGQRARRALGWPEPGEAAGNKTSAP